MTSRGLVTAWLAGLVLVLLTVAAIVALGWNRASIQFSMGDAKVAVVGTSLLRNAVPFKPPEGGLLGDGRVHRRIGVSGLTQAEAMAALEQVVDQNAELVFLEANPFVVDYAGRGNRPPDRWSPKSWWSRNVGVPFRRGIDRLQGRNLVVYLRAEALLDAKFAPKKATLRKLYPLSVRDPSDPQRLRRVVDKAKKAGIRLVLVVPPRPRSVAEVMGPGNIAKLRDQSERVAAAYGLELWVFGTDWPDELFADHAHMNKAGRERFVTELRQRYQDAS